MSGSSPVHGNRSRTAAVITSVLISATGVWAVARAMDASGASGLPTPVLGKTVDVVPVTGQVFVTLPGQGSVPLLAPRQIPVGSVLDTRRGTVRLITAANGTGTMQSCEFRGGSCQVRQRVAGRGLTDLVLTGGSFADCGKGAAAGAKPPRVVRQVHASAHGSFRTNGRYSTATGSTWDTADECDGTRITDEQGTVHVSSGSQRRTLSRGQEDILYTRQVSPKHINLVIDVGADRAQRFLFFLVLLRTPERVTRFQLCVLTPDGIERCPTFRLNRYGRNPFVIGSEVCNQPDGPGIYIVRFLVGGRTVGDPLSVTFTRPRPPPLERGCTDGSSPF